MKHKDMPFSKRLAWVIVAIVAIHVAALTGWIQMAQLGGALWSIGFLAYLLGMRHAFDVDHIAAIDNVTRRLRHEGQRPVAVGLFFSLGHSTIVVLATVALVVASQHLREMLPTLKWWGVVIGTAVSAAFLILIGIANTVIVKRLWQQRGNVYASDPAAAGEIENLLQSRGFMARLIRFAYRRIDSSKKMYFVGLLFGLGFDTASEVILLALTAVAAKAYGMSSWSVLTLPLLFAAGMTLMDSLCNVGMLRLYDWSINGGRKTWIVNTGVTSLSVLLAFGVGFAELFNVFQWPMATLNGSIAGVLTAAIFLVVIKHYSSPGIPSV